MGGVAETGGVGSGVATATAAPDGGRGLSDVGTGCLTAGGDTQMCHYHHW